jgi:preprotein translocase subunit YajC
MTNLLFLAQDSSSSGGPAPLIMMVLMFVVMYFFIIRRQQKEHQERISKLKTGDKVITAGGIHGVITNVKEKTVVVRIAESVRVEVEKASVSTVLVKSTEPEPAELPSTQS